MLCSQSQGEMRLKYKFYSSPHISYLPRDMGKMTIFDKNTTSFAFYKASKKAGISQKAVSFVLTVLGGLNSDEDCLATPDPTTSMFLYWINTNRMGTAKMISAMFFILKKTFF